jgi:hypothetical protein
MSRLGPRPERRRNRPVEELNPIGGGEYRPQLGAANEQQSV